MTLFRAFFNFMSRKKVCHFVSFLFCGAAIIMNRERYYHMSSLKYNGKDVGLFTLCNSSGIVVRITNFGARIVSLSVPDRDGRLCDVVQGFDSVEDCFPENYDNYFGAVIGRYANRLAGGRIVVDGVVYQLPQNNGPNCLHGGPTGWHNQPFDVVEASERRLVLSLESPDGDNGFPGNVQVRVTYTLDDCDRLRIDYCAESDRATVINITNHSYWNLSGDLGSSVLDHILWIDADRYTPTDATAIPLGENDSVQGTPFDFRIPKAIGRDIEDNHPQLVIGRGYDHNFVLNNRIGAGELRMAASLYSPKSGIQMLLFTDAPGMQLYTGNYLDGTPGKGGVRYGFRSAVCLETQQYPDSPNRAWPESTGRLTPEKPFESSTVFGFKFNE